MSRSINGNIIIDEQGKVNENNLVNHWIEVYQHYSKKKEQEDDRRNEKGA